LLWFDEQAEDAAKFYSGIFKNSKILSVSRYSKAGFEIHRRPEDRSWWSSSSSTGSGLPR